MKKGFYILIIFFTSFSCKKNDTQIMTVIHDCTGQYLRLNNLDHPICNIDKVVNIPNGTVVQASYVLAQYDECIDRVTGQHCATFHNHLTSNKWIIIKTIKIVR